MLTSFKRILYLLFDLDEMIIEFENKNKHMLNLATFRMQMQIYNTFTEEIYDEYILLFDQNGDCVMCLSSINSDEVTKQDIVYFDILAKKIKTNSLKNYKKYVILAYDDNSLYEACINSNDSYLILVNDEYINNKINKLKVNSYYINIFDDNILRLYQTYKSNILNQIRNKNIILNIGVESDKIKHIYAKEDFILLVDLKIKYKLYLDQIKNNRQKIYNSLKTLKANIYKLLEKYYYQKLSDYVSVTAYKYGISENITGFIINCKFDYTNVLDLILYSDFVSTIIKS